MVTRKPWRGLKVPVFKIKETCAPQYEQTLVIVDVLSIDVT